MEVLATDHLTAKMLLKSDSFLKLKCSHLWFFNITRYYSLLQLIKCDSNLSLVSIGYKCHERALEKFPLTAASLESPLFILSAKFMIRKLFTVAPFHFSIVHLPVMKMAFNLKVRNLKMWNICHRRTNIIYFFTILDS